MNIVLCQETCEPICFKLGIMLDTTKLYSLIPVWMFPQGHRIHSIVELHESTWMFLMFDYVREILCGEYGSIEHLLFFLFGLLVC